MAITKDRFDSVSTKILDVENEFKLAGTTVNLDATELNSLDVTPGTGAVSKALVLNSSGSVTMPDGGYVDLSNAAVAAAGNGQSTFTQIADQLNAVTGADGTKGVALPAASAGRAILVINTDQSNNLKVSPINSGNDQINSLTAGTGVFTMGPARAAWFIPTSATQWYVTGDAATTLTPTQVGALAVGVAAGYKIARGVSAVTGTATVVTGLTTVVSVTATAQDDLDGDALAGVSATIGDQAGSPAAGSVILKCWKVTTGGAAGNPTMIAATAAKNVNWVAVGT